MDSTLLRPCHPCTLIDLSNQLPYFRRGQSSPAYLFVSYECNYRLKLSNVADAVKALSVEREHSAPPDFGFLWNVLASWGVRANHT